MNNVKPICTTSIRGNIIVCTIITLSLLVIMALHTRDKNLLPERTQEKPMVEIAPGLSNLLLKI